MRKVAHVMHDHGSSGALHDFAAAARSHRKRLAVAFGITVTILLAEIVGAVWTGSLALLVDAGHMLTDAGGLAMALFASYLTTRAASDKRTWGFRRAEERGSCSAGPVGGVVMWGSPRCGRRSRLLVANDSLS